ncbi:MAG: radical SAM protein [Myxococcales bacterium]|nr:radical SAM protein [Myxococcales bacterium]
METLSARPATVATQVTERLLHETSSMCRICKNVMPARVVARGDDVWMKKRCERHGPQDIKIGNNAAWYERTRAIPNAKLPPLRVVKEVTHGCPFDCGPCTSHQQKTRLPVVPITSSCNLDCPICYTINKNEGAYHMTRDELAKILDHLREDHGGEIDIINFTGGEPTVHPDFVGFMEMAKAAGIHRITVSTNGVLLARDEALVKRLAELDTRIVLSFDSFEVEADKAMQGATLLSTKARVLELLEKYDVDTTLIPVMVKGMNDHEIGRMIDLAVKKPFIRSLEIHTMTYTGQGGVNFDRSGRMSPYEVLQSIEKSTGGLLVPDDFVPSPCAHPLCYQIAFLLVDPDGGAAIPFTRFMSPETLYDLLSDRLYIEPSEKLERAVQDAINAIWAGESRLDEAEAERTLRILKRLLRDLFPRGAALPRRDAQRLAERASKAIYLHSHMDEETFDTERIAQCCVGVPNPDGTNIPTCSYNVLYRETDDRFNAHATPWNERSGGRKEF